jgi:apolipoprotein D and lipocalin family protein
MSSFLPSLRPASVAAACALVAIAGCQSPSMKPLAVAPHVELERFMGDWYVIANIPTFLERGAHNAVESYRLDSDGSIATTFTYRKDAFDGPEKSMEPRGFVKDTKSNAVWGMQFIWPIKADYRIAFVSPDYSQTVVGREKRDYVWIMARTPTLPEADYQRLMAFVAEQGYDVSKVRKVPQQWDRR